MNVGWSFAESIPASRQAILSADMRFGDLMVRIVHSARHSGARWQVARLAPLIGAVRFEVFIESSDSNAIDCFHNGRGGYRAHYAMIEECGDGVNEEAVAAVTCLVRNAMATLPNEFGVDTEAVLVGRGAKVWIDQDISVIREALRGVQVQPELLVERWVRAAARDEFVLIRGNRRFKANAGVLAPIPTRLAFRSAWWRDRSVVTDPDKIERSRHLYIYGFA